MNTTTNTNTNATLTNQSITNPTLTTPTLTNRPIANHTSTTAFKRIVTLTLSVVVCAVGVVGLFSGCSKDDDITVTTVENGEVVVKKIKKEDLVVMPNVVGMNKDEAVKTLEDLGLAVKINKFAYDKNNEDKSITFQSKEIDEIVNKGSTIELTVNSIEYPFLYELNDDGTLSIKKNIDWELNIPSEVMGYSVTRILEDGMLLPNKCKVVIPNTITKIDKHSFNSHRGDTAEIIIQNKKENVDMGEQYDVFTINFLY